jgi:hypothetical protein
VLHHDVRAHFTNTRVDDVDDVGMPNAVDRLRFLKKSLRKLGVFRQFGMQKLDRYGASGEHVLRFEDMTHPATTDAFSKAVLVVDD